jgi:hypothetical protein
MSAINEQEGPGEEMEYIKIIFMVCVEVMITESISLFIFHVDFSEIQRSKKKMRNKQQKIKKSNL